MGCVKNVYNRRVLFLKIKCRVYKEYRRIETFYTEIRKSYIFKRFSTISKIPFQIKKKTYKILIPLNFM